MRKGHTHFCMRFPCSKAIYVRACFAVITIAGEMVRPQGVNGDKYNVALPAFQGSAADVSPGDQEHEQHQRSTRRYA